MRPNHMANEKAPPARFCQFLGSICAFWGQLRPPTSSGRPPAKHALEGSTRVHYRGLNAAQQSVHILVGHANQSCSTLRTCQSLLCGCVCVCRSVTTFLFAV